MRKLFALGAVLAIAATVVGCGKKSKESSGSSDGGGGNSREQIVQNFCAAFRSCDKGLLSEISFSMKDEGKVADGGTRKKNVLTPLLKMAKSKEPVKTKILKSATVKKMSASIIEATCEGVDTVYFFVGHEDKEDGKDEDDKIMSITADKEKVDRSIKFVEELEKNGEKAARDDDEREDARDRRYSSATNAVAMKEVAKPAEAAVAKSAEKSDYVRPVGKAVKADSADRGWGVKAVKADSADKGWGEKAVGAGDDKVSKYESYVREAAQLMGKVGGPKISEDEIQKEIRNFKNKSSSEQEKDLAQAEEMLKMIKREINSAKK